MAERCVSCGVVLPETHVVCCCCGKPVCESCRINPRGDDMRCPSCYDAMMEDEED